MSKPNSCYMCASAATSREHAPPRCIFPTRADTDDGADHRLNLITVPSCEVHNSEKSNNDEYLLFCLAGSYTSSPVGLTQFLTKVHRAFNRAPRKRQEFVHQSGPVQLKRVENSDWERGAQVIVDGARLDEVLSSCACALYFHHTNNRFLGTAEVITNFTMYLDKEHQRAANAIFDETASLLATSPDQGANPRVFYYRFAEINSVAYFYFCFYEASSVVVQLKRVAVAEA